MDIYKYRQRRQKTPGWYRFPYAEARADWFCQAHYWTGRKWICDNDESWYGPMVLVPTVEAAEAKLRCPRCVRKRPLRAIVDDLLR